jgi:hypothetical protein
MAEKSFVNDDAVTFGVPPEEELVLEPPEDELVLELEDELPQPTTTRATTSMGKRARNQRTTIKTLLSVKALTWRPPSSLLARAQDRPEHTPTLSYQGGSVHLN